MLKSVFEFIITFTENHFEACIINCHNHSVSVSLSTTSISDTTTILVIQFIERLIELTCSTMDPILLCRIFIVWNKMMSIQSLKLFITMQLSSQCLKLSIHILTVCLLKTNKDYMYDNMNELINDLQCSLYVDAFVLHMLAPIIATYPKTSNLSIDKV